MSARSSDATIFVATRSAPVVHHTIERWGVLVARTLGASADPRALADWARLVGVSVSTLRATCYLAGISPRRSLVLARLLRVLVAAQAACCQPQDLLDVRDPRTLQHLLEMCGVMRTDLGDMTPAEFLGRQTLVAPCTALEVLQEFVAEWVAHRAMTR